jgi:hypothetical protein
LAAEIARELFAKVAQDASLVGAAGSSAGKHESHTRAVTTASGACGDAHTIQGNEASGPRKNDPR